MSEPNEREDLEQFLSHPGWLRFMSYVKTEWGAPAMVRKLKQAIDEAMKSREDPAQAVLRVNAQHDAVNELMLWPVTRAKQLEAAEQIRKLAGEPPLSRRGTL